MYTERHAHIHIRPNKSREREKNKCDKLIPHIRFVIWYARSVAPSECLM